MAIANKVTIEIDGNKLSGFLNFSLNQRMYQPHEFSLVCRRDEFEQSGDSPLSASVSKIGSGITVKIEGINSGVTTGDIFFKGIVTGISTSESMGGIQEIILRGFSPDILLHGYPTCRSYDNQTLQDIAKLVMQPYPSDQIALSGSPNNDAQFPYIVQYKENDYEFLGRLARRFGQWFFHDGRNLVFGTFEKKSVKGILGINLVDFQIGANLAPLNFKMMAIDWPGHNTLEESSDDAGWTSTDHLDAIGKRVHDQSLARFPEKGNYYFSNSFNAENGSYVHSAQEARAAFLEKRSIESRYVVINGRTNEAIQLGNVFKIKAHHQDKDIDVGDFLVTGINHSIDNSMTYGNSFHGIPSSLPLSPDVNVRAASVCETQPAWVVDNNDPEKAGRVKVRFLWQEAGQKSTWVQMANQHGGKNTGFYFIPEVDQGVLVGFEGGDPQHPYIIGTFYDGKDKPDEKWVTSSNDIKAIRTKSGNTIEFHDTQGKEKLVIYNEASGASNKITLDIHSHEIRITSGGNIKLQAGGDIELSGENIMLHANKKVGLGGDKGVVLVAGMTDAQAGGEIHLKDSGDIEVSVDMACSFSLSVGSGNKRIDASVEGIDITGPQIGVKADAMAEISGAMVKIN